MEMAAEFIISLKRILLLSIWGQSYKTFLSVIYEFWYKARVFVKQGCERLLETNTLAYYENSLIPEKKVL